MGRKSKARRERRKHCADDDRAAIAAFPPWPDETTRSRGTLDEWAMRVTGLAMTDLHAVIRRTTEMIESGQFADDRISSLYLIRAEAHERLAEDAETEGDRGRGEPSAPGSWRAAIADYSRAIELDPKNLDAVNRLARLRLNRGEQAFDRQDFRMAIEELEYAAAGFRAMRSPETGHLVGFATEDLALSCFLCGKAYAARSNFLRAIERYDEALPHNNPCWGDPLPILGYRGDAWKRLNKPERAVKDWIAALKDGGPEEIERWRGRLKPDSLAATALAGGEVNQEVRRALINYAHGRAD